MTHEEFRAEIKAIPDLELHNKGQALLSRLCETGGGSFVMSIPPQINDSDMILSEIIKRFGLLAIKPSEVDRCYTSKEVKEIIERSFNEGYVYDEKYHNERKEILSKEYGIKI